MNEFRWQLLLSIATAALAVAILAPVFIGVKLMLDAGLEVVFIGVVSLGLLVAYVLRQSTSR